MHILFKYSALTKKDKKVKKGSNKSKGGVALMRNKYGNNTELKISIQLF